MQIRLGDLEVLRDRWTSDCVGQHYSLNQAWWDSILIFPSKTCVQWYELQHWVQRFISSSLAIKGSWGLILSKEQHQETKGCGCLTEWQCQPRFLVDLHHHSHMWSTVICVCVHACVCEILGVYLYTHFLTFKQVKEDTKHKIHWKKKYGSTTMFSQFKNKTRKCMSSYRWFSVQVFSPLYVWVICFLFSYFLRSLHIFDINLLSEMKQVKTFSYSVVFLFTLMCRTFPV